MNSGTSRATRHSMQLAIACLFSALLCASAYITIPLAMSPVPLALGNFFAVLAGLLIGPLWGALSSLLYILVGALGFPVFSGGRGGIAHLAGPTGGYLAGYCLGAMLAGLLSRKRGIAAVVIGSVLGFAAVLATGSAGLVLLSGADWPKAAAIGVLPFLPGDALKAASAALVAYRLRPFLESLLQRGGSHGR